MSDDLAPTSYEDSLEHMADRIFRVTAVGLRLCPSVTPDEMFRLAGMCSLVAMEREEAEWDGLRCAENYELSQEVEVSCE